MKREPETGEPGFGGQISSCRNFFLSSCAPAANLTCSWESKGKEQREERVPGLTSTERNESRKEYYECEHRTQKEETTS